MYTFSLYTLYTQHKANPKMSRCLKEYIQNRRGKRCRVEHIYIIIIITSLKAHSFKGWVCTVTALQAKSYQNKTELPKLGI